jgi:hypothetical protein
MKGPCDLCRKEKDCLASGRVIGPCEYFEVIERCDHHASPGDYIIKGVNGEFYPCKPDIFAKTYESATLTPPNEWVSVEDAVPDPGVRVLAANGNFVGEAYMASNGAWMRHDGFPWEVDAWIPLPAPPDRRPPEGEA